MVIILCTSGLYLVGAIKIEYENIEFENGNNEKQSGEPLSQMPKFDWT